MLLQVDAVNNEAAQAQAVANAMEQSWEMISDHFATQGGGTGDTASSR